MKRYGREVVTLYVTLEEAASLKNVAISLGYTQREDTKHLAAITRMLGAVSRGELKIVSGSSWPMTAIVPAKGKRVVSEEAKARMALAQRQRRERERASEV
jgi:hypothetical protein